MGRLRSALAREYEDNPVCHAPTFSSSFLSFAFLSKIRTKALRVFLHGRNEAFVLDRSLPLHPLNVSLYFVSHFTVDESSSFFRSEMYLF